MHPDAKLMIGLWVLMAYHNNYVEYIYILLYIYQYIQYCSILQVTVTPCLPSLLYCLGGFSQHLFPWRDDVMSGLHNKAGKFCKLITGWSLSIGWSLIIGWSMLISWVIWILEACWISVRPFPIFCPLARWGGQPFHFPLYLPIGPPQQKDREARRGCYMLLSLSLHCLCWWIMLVVI